ncbi:AAA family ATPase [Clostridium thermobutyricum]|uniref:AAA family ATPase n=1 Tax=Clostridium thermobutyricum TaxID=29372 RepID=UPI003F52095F
MIIKKITIKNFRSYEDETTFDLEPKNGRNIILIGGENGAGKSTLFQAMKLCFYGPVSYGYQGLNSVYISKIKSNINHNAFKEEKVLSFINIEIILNEGTEKNIYTLKRSWTYEDLKLQEHFEVLKNSLLLDKDSTLYFENYIKTILPPSLFEFFFFDGEELAEHFVGKSANTHIKDALLQLCNYDTFDILKKSLKQYQRNNSSLDSEIKLKQEKYDSTLLEFNNIEKEIANLIDSKNTLSFDLENLIIERDNLKSEFKKAGGLLEAEKSSLTQRFTNLEKERDEINSNIKLYCNNDLPFLISNNLLYKVKNQLLKEKELSSFKDMKNKINEDILKEVAIEIEGNSNIDFNKFSNLLLDKLYSKDITLGNVKSIHMLSFEQENTVFNLINKIQNNSDKLKNNIKNYYKRLSEISNEIKEIRNTLNSSLEDKILENFIKNTNILNEKISKIESEIAVLDSNIKIKELEHSKINYNLVRAKNDYLNTMQSTNSLNISDKLIKSLTTIISRLTHSKIKILEKEFIYIFKSIIRKDSYIDTIKFDNDFNPTLYIYKDYSNIDIFNLVNNLGLDDLKKKYGDKFVDTLYSNYNVKSKSELMNYLENNITLDLITIPTKVNLNDFSSGEKQIYILCLIWALIKASDVEIPFTIDTPYGRIDETHRFGLTTKYLPKISNQVIILSTNEEIDSNAYELIKDYLCNEYLLEYLNTERKTIVHNKYFFEVN